MVITSTNTRTNRKRSRCSPCSIITAYMASFVSLFNAPTTNGLRQYRYYNTVENYPVPPNKFRSTKYHTQEEINKAWVRVYWTHGGHYYHNKLTREDVDSL